MSNLNRYFSSRAKTRILEVLFGHKHPLSLRQLASLAEVGVRSAEVALSNLKKEGLVFSESIGNRVIFNLHTGHRDHSLLQNLFKMVVEHDLQERARSFRDLGKQVLAFNHHAATMLGEAKRPQ